MHSQGKCNQLNLSKHLHNVSNEWLWTITSVCNNFGRRITYKTIHIKTGTKYKIRKIKININQIHSNAADATILKLENRFYQQLFIHCSLYCIWCAEQMRFEKIITECFDLFLMYTMLLLVSQLRLSTGNGRKHDFFRSWKPFFKG